MRSSYLHRGISYTGKISAIFILNQPPGPRFNIKMTSYQYRKSNCGDKTILRPSYLHNGISYNGKTTSLYWIEAQVSPGSHISLPPCCWCRWSVPSLDHCLPHQLQIVISPQLLAAWLPITIDTDTAYRPSPWLHRPLMTHNSNLKFIKILILPPYPNKIWCKSQRHCCCGVPIF